MSYNNRFGLDFGEPPEQPSFWARLRAAFAGVKDRFTSSPTGWRCSRCGGTDSMFESMDPEDPTVEICKSCGHKERY